MNPDGSGKKPFRIYPVQTKNVIDLINRKPMSRGKINSISNFPILTINLIDTPNQ